MLKLAAQGLTPFSLALLAAGCGGSNNNGGGNNNLTTIPLTSNVRLYQLGDSWTWSVNGSETPPGQAAEILQATKQFTVSAVSPSGTTNQVLLTENTQLTLNGNTTSNTEVVTLDQNNTTGATQEVSYSNNGSTYTVTSNTGYSVPGSFSNAETESGTLAFSDGSSSLESFAIQSEASSTTTADGVNWNTWQVLEGNKTTSTGGTDTESTTSQWAPALGQYVYESINETLDDGTLLKETSTLTATTVPASAWGVNPTYTASKRTVSRR